MAAPCSMLFVLRRGAVLLPFALFAMAGGIRLVDPDTTYHMEVLSLASSQETWMRQWEGDAAAWRTPSLAGQPRVRKPPGIIWTNYLAWFGLDPATSSVDERVGRSRIVALAVYGGLAVGGVGLTGWLLGGAGLAWRSSLILATMLGVVRQVRLASYDTHLGAWTAAAAALGLLAICTGESRAGRALWIGVAAAACAGWAAWMKGPIAFLFAGLPWLLGAVVLARRRLRALGLVAFMTGLGALFILPWFGHILPRFPAVLATEYRAARSSASPPWYYLGVLGLMLPWTFAWLSQAVSAGLAGVRAPPAYRFAALWFLLGFILLSLAEAKQQRYIFPLLPAGALMAGQWWRRLSDPPAGMTPSERERRFFRRAHGSLLVVGTLGVGAFLLLQPLLVERGLLDGYELPGVTLLGAVSALGSAVLLAGIGCRELGRRPAAALAATGVWFTVLFAFGMRHYVDSAHGRYAEREAAAAFALRAPEREIPYLRLERDFRIRPDHKFALYAQKRMPPLTDVGRLGLGRPDAPAWIVARDLPWESELLLRCGYESALRYREGAYPRVLWRRRMDLAARPSPPGGPREAHLRPCPMDEAAMRNPGERHYGLMSSQGAAERGRGSRQTPDPLREPEMRPFPPAALVTAPAGAYSGGL